MYIRSTHTTEALVQIICSKNRLAPLKRVTLPRLELIAALVGARLLNYLCKETGHDTTRATLWSDSTVALGWICSDPKRWKPFVANRVMEIQSYTTPSQWMHCPGEDNPADHLSRGVSAENLQELQNWWHGPSWLSQDPYHSPIQKTRPPNTLPEERSQSLLIRPTRHMSTSVRRFQLQLILEIASRYSMGFSLCAICERKEGNVKGIGRLRAKGSTSVLDQRGAEGLLRAGTSSSPGRSTYSARITGGAVQPFFWRTV